MVTSYSGGSLVQVAICSSYLVRVATSHVPGSVFSLEVPRSRRLYLVVCRAFFKWFSPSVVQGAIRVRAIQDRVVHVFYRS